MSQLESPDPQPWMEMVRQRRSCRAFTSEPLSPSVLAQLEESCLRSPSGKNKRPWRYVFVTDLSLRQALSRCKPHGAAFLTEAPLVVVICGDDQRSDTWVEDCAIAATLLQFTAQSLSLGSCWCQVRLRMADENTTAEAWVRKAIQLPGELRVASIIGVGHPAEVKPPVPFDELPQNQLQHLA